MKASRYVKAFEAEVRLVMKTQNVVVLKVCIEASWLIRAELIPVSVAWSN